MLKHNVIIFRIRTKVLGIWSPFECTASLRAMVHAPSRPQAGAPPVRINLYSDTQTRPTPAMKDAMMRAEMGDEQHGDDPTVHALNDRMAALMGKEAAMFLPSGTMCNVIAILTHCRKGDEVVAHETSHIRARREKQCPRKRAEPGRTH